MNKHHIHSKKHKNKSIDISLNRNPLLTRENISGNYTNNTTNNTNSTPSNCLYIVDPYTFKDLESARQLHATDSKVTYTYI